MNEKAAIQGYDISSFSAAVIGCGGLGTNVSVHLAGAGIGKLWLCDYDIVQARNLNRQFFYTPSDIGQPKCGILAQRLAHYAPEAEILSINRKINSVSDLNFAAKADILILAVDNQTTRSVVNRFCFENNLPLVNGGVDGAFGTAYLFVPGKTADLAAAGALHPPVHPPVSQSPTVGIIGALQAKLATDHLLGKSDSQGILLCFDGLEIHALRIQYKGDDAT